MCREQEGAAEGPWAAGARASAPRAAQRKWREREGRQTVWRAVSDCLTEEAPWEPPPQSPEEREGNQADVREIKLVSWD